ncbi:hypothetical protein [Shouchella clausii]|uniref:hypothetical protein n=1 Tax=Shouchella clausii TaxID=79880 RepID=UPI00211CCF79|nr:hypothetical protein [Shouchella clausii]
MVGHRFPAKVDELEKDINSYKAARQLPTSKVKASRRVVSVDDETLVLIRNGIASKYSAI